MTDKYWAVDGANDEWSDFDTEQAAIDCAEGIIDEYRDNCDPEWPMGVMNIVVVFGTRAGTSDFDWEGCKLLYRSTETYRKELEPEDAEAQGVDYTCDYKMVKIND